MFCLFILVYVPMEVKKRWFTNCRSLIITWLIAAANFFEAVADNENITRYFDESACLGGTWELDRPLQNLNKDVVPNIYFYREENQDDFRNKYLYFWNPTKPESKKSDQLKVLGSQLYKFFPVLREDKGIYIRLLEDSANNKPLERQVFNVSINSAPQLQDEKITLELFSENGEPHLSCGKIRSLGSPPVGMAFWTTGYNESELVFHFDINYLQSGDKKIFESSGSIVSCGPSKVVENHCLFKEEQSKWIDRITIGVVEFAHSPADVNRPVVFFGIMLFVVAIAVTALAMTAARRRRTRSAQSDVGTVYDDYSGYPASQVSIAGDSIQDDLTDIISASNDSSTTI